MTTLPFHRLLLSAALTSTLVVTGCDISSESEEAPVSPLVYDVGGPCPVLDAATGACELILVPPSGPGIPAFYIPGTHPRFTPAASDLPLNTDIVFSGTTDGTAIVSGTGTVQNALNDLDGWSPNAYFDIPFSAAIDPASVNANPLSPTQNVFLLPIESTGDALDPANINVGAPFDPAKVAATTYTASVVSLDGGADNVLRIKPTSPLLPKKKYLVILTNGILDGTAATTTASGSYELLGLGSASACAAAGVNTALQPLCTIIGGWESLAAGYISARNTAFGTTPTDPTLIKPLLTLTYTFTTTDPTTPLIGMGGPRAALFAASGNNPSSISGINTADAGGLLSSPKPRTVTFPTPAAFTGSAGNTFDLNTLSGGALAASVAKLYTGSITLPYYQTKPAAAGDFTVLGKFWTGDDTLAGAMSLPLPADSDGSYNVTYRYPFAKKTSDVTVPLQVTMPNPAMTPAGFPASCGTVYGSSGYPVVIYVHGITSDRTSVIALAHSLAGSACIATVAIDLPMHGIPAVNSASAAWHFLNVDRADLSDVDTGNASADERHFEFATTTNNLPTAMNFSSPTALDGSGSWFINLATLQNSRDNLRQAVMDLLNLNASLANINAIDMDGDANATNDDFDLTKVSVVGVSLGGMVATNFVTVNQAVIGNETAVNTAVGSTVFPIRLNPVKALAASVTGGQLTRVLEASRAFGPRILAALTNASAAPGTSNYEKFMYTAQSTVDSGDPVNFAQTLAALPASLKVPVLMQEIVGGGNAGDGAYPADLVVPNNANAAVTHDLSTLLGQTPGTTTYTTDTAPLAGTDPLLTLLGITVSATDPGIIDVATEGAAVSKLSIGYHSSLLTSAAGGPPDDGNLLATSELQTEVVTFINSAGASTAFGTAPGGANTASAFTTVLTR